jgi:hypothetical protein
VTLLGALILAFGQNGCCTELREYWHLDAATHSGTRWLGTISRCTTVMAQVQSPGAPADRRTGQIADQMR